MPLHRHPFPVIVAPPGIDPEIRTIRGLMTNAEPGVNFHKGVYEE